MSDKAGNMNSTSTQKVSFIEKNRIWNGAFGQ